MAGASMKKWRKNKIRQCVKEQTADKVVNSLRGLFLEPTEENLQELSEMFAELLTEEEQNKQKEE